MRRLIWKTVGITLAVIFGTVAVVFGSLTLFYPKAMGDLFAEAGNYSATVWFYERQYGKTSSFEDLVCLVVCLDENRDGETTAKYSTELLTSSEFNAYVESGEHGGFTNSEQAREFFYGKCAVANANAGKLSEAITVAKNFVERVGYTDYNPFRIIIVSCCDTLNAIQLEQLKNGISELGITNETVTLDLQDIQNKINAKGE